ncbi:MAG: helix-turn-helix domain-containing protein [Polaromonas sp.]
MQKATRRRATDTLEQISWNPPGGYALDLEVLSIADLRQRGTEAHFRRPQRVHFHHLLIVTRGQCTHVVDFVPHACHSGTCLVLPAGQVQKYDFSRPWAGWLVVFPPEFVAPASDARLRDTLSVAHLFEALPTRLTLDRETHREVQRTIVQMRTDARLPASAQLRNALLRHQLCALLLRLSTVAPESGADRPAAASLARFRRFRELVEQHYRQWHQVAPYADRLGCASKSLTRATQDVAGVSAKAFVAQRITLEAKRLLVHTTESVQGVGAALGFDEPTNFVKFFRREAGCTPQQFRLRQAG